MPDWPLKQCPSCGRPGGLIFCPICHGTEKNPGESVVEHAKSNATDDMEVSNSSTVDSTSSTEVSSSADENLTKE